MIAAGSAWDCEFGWVGNCEATLETSLKELQVIKVPLQHLWGRIFFFLIFFVRVSPNQDGKIDEQLSWEVKVCQSV